MSYGDLFYALSSPVVAFCLQMLLNRLLYPKLSAQLIALLSIGLAALVCILPTKSFLLSSFITLGALHVYFHFFNMSETARRIRILLAIQRNEKYPEEQGLSERVTRLIQLGLVKVQGGHLELTKNPLKYLALWIVKFEHCLFPERRV